MPRNPSARATAASTSPSTRATTPAVTERAQRRPDRHAARAARQLGHVVVRVGDRRDRRQVLRVRAERRGHRRFVADDGDPAVVGHVEGLVRVRRPRVGALARPRTGVEDEGMPRPTARTRRRRAPTLRAGGRRRSRRRSRRTRRNGRRRPAARRSRARRARRARRPGPRRRCGPARRRRRSRGAPRPAMRPAEHDGGVHGAAGEEADRRRALDAARSRRARDRAARRRARRSGRRGSRWSRRSRSRRRCRRAGRSSFEQPVRRDLFDGGRGGRGLA